MKKVAFILFALSAINGSAHAGTCTANITTPVLFTQVNPLTSGIYDATATLTVNCTGFIIGTTIGVCQDIGAGSGGVNTSNQRLLVGQTSRGVIPFQIFQDPARTIPWGSTSNSLLGGLPLLTLTGNGTTAATMYLRLYAQNPPYTPDTYTSLFSGADSRVHYGGLLSALSCNGLLSILTQTTDDPFTVQTAVAAFCLIQVTQNVDFGSASQINSNIDTTAALSVQCANGAAYQIGLGPGNGSGATTSLRKMTGRGNATIGYALYQNAGRTQNWGNTLNSDTVGGVGDGSTAAITVYARISPQTVTASGTYNDTVVVTITY